MVKTYRITITAVVTAKSERKADKLLTRMLDAVEDELVESTSDIEEATDE